MQICFIPCNRCPNDFNVSSDGGPEHDAHANHRQHSRGTSSMTDAYPPLRSILSSFASVFPTLKPAQIERLAALGRVRQVQPGEVLVEAGEKGAPLFVIKTGQVEVVQPSGGNE